MEQIRPQQFKKDCAMVMKKRTPSPRQGKPRCCRTSRGRCSFSSASPFNQMENAHLAYLVEQCLLRFYAPGETIIKPADGPVEHFYIVKQGRVIGERPHSAKGGTETTFEITTGECFPSPRCWANGPRAPNTGPARTRSACN